MKIISSVKENEGNDVICNEVYAMSLYEQIARGFIFRIV